MSQPLLSEALERAELLFDRAALDAAIARLGAQINADLAGQRPVFMTIMNGGLIFGGHLALALGFDCEFDYCHASRYRGGTSGGSLDWIKAPRTALEGRHVLLVDDIFDEGYTLRAVRDYCLGQGARSVRIAVLCRKLHQRAVSDLFADYVGLDVPDRYVFGFGMDYYEQGRNLAGIYAL